jgi:hypothetical protein
MIRTLFLFSFFLTILSGLFPPQISAQSSLNIDSLQSVLVTQMRLGNRRALRDMATFLDKPASANTARCALLKHTFFTTSELDVSKASREQFLSFFYDNEKRLKYSDMLAAFYITPVENQQTELKFSRESASEMDPSVSLRFLTSRFDSLASKKIENIDCQRIIHEIAVLETPEAYDWLRRTLNALPFGKKATAINLALCEALSNEPTAENLKAVLNAVEQGFAPESLLSVAFLQFTNCTTSPRQARFWLDSLGSSEGLRTFGYERMFAARASFFFDKVDYFGQILVQQNAPDWLQQSVRYDMLTTKTPRLLFYLAAQMRLKPEKSAFYEDYLRKMTKINLKNGAYTEGSFKPADDLATIEKQKDIIRWWAIHAEDFEWDESEHRFVSKAEAVARAEELERQVRRLGSSNDSVAFAAFVHLTEGDPPTVIALVERFRPILRAYNPHLPPLNYTYLEQMTALSAYCRKHGFSLKLSPNLSNLLDSLRQPILEKTRYKIENQLLAEVKIGDISAIEYIALLHSTNADFGFSTGRIVDIFYSKNWKSVLDNDAQLRLYLKKSAIFKNIGVAGVSSLYDKKFDRRDERVRLRLAQIARSESDGDIQDNLQDWRTTASLAQKIEDGGGSPTHQNDETANDESIDSRLRRLQADGSFSIADLNAVVVAPKFNDSYKPLVIKLLKKITPLSSIRGFKLKNWLKASSDLASFADMEIGAKDLDDVVRIFDMDNDTTMWSFIATQSANYSMAERAGFWNSMFKVTWFNDVLYSNNLKTTQRDLIVVALRKYLTPTDEVLSEFEEQTTLVHIAELENVGRSLAQKLEATLALDAPEAMKAAVQMSILARLNYDEIGTAVRYAYRYSKREEGTNMTFLTLDFGIPFFNYDKDEWAQFIDNHASMSKKQFYMFYLQKFGVSFQNTDLSRDNREGSLNFQKIYEILRFDAVQPFTGGGAHRDFFTFGIIKLLEFEFKTQLGFHEKLNENQIFYVNNASKRAAEWRAFLLNKKLVKQNPDESISFNE